MSRLPVNQKIRINVLRAAFIVLLLLLLFVDPYFGYDTIAHEILEAAGIILLVTGVLGRFWSILYIGGMKNRSVVQDGPYSMTRNPLYLFSTIAATGIGLMMGAFSFAVVVGASIGGILYVTAMLERDFLRAQFGSAYDAYAERVPFFFPNPRLFHTERETTFSIAALRRNLFDACVFLSFIPLVEIVDWFKANHGWSLIAVY